MEDSVPVKEEYTYQVGKIQFIVTPVYKNKGESNSIQNQKKILQKAAKDKGYTDTIFFVDEGITGTTMKRPGFQKMIAAIEAGYISAVFVKDYCAIIGLNQKDLENQGILA